MLTQLIEDTRRALEASLAAPPFVHLASALHRRHRDDACEHILASITTSNGLQSRLKAIEDEVFADMPERVPGSFERLLLMRQQLKALPQIAPLPVSEDVKRLFCEEFQYVATPPRGAVFDAAETGRHSGVEQQLRNEHGLARVVVTHQCNIADFRTGVDLHVDDLAEDFVNAAEIII